MTKLNSGKEGSDNLLLEKMSETILVSELDIILKKVIVRYYSIITIILFLFSIFYFYQGIAPMNYMLFICFIGHILSFYIPYKLDYTAIEPLISFYLFLICIAVFPIVVAFWQIGQITAFIWYLLVPLGAMVFFSIRKVIFWSITIFIFICVCFIVEPLIPDKYVMSVSESQSTLINILTIISCLSLFYYFVYYINKINQIRMVISQENGGVKSDLIYNEGEYHENTEKYNEIYSTIVQYFDENRPYCDPDFTISQLASSIHSNGTYISRTIRHCADTNFNIFVNTYRIRMIKEMFDKGYHNTYTIKYIYTSSGFKQQTTFNKVFKQIEGITPSDYIKSLSETETELSINL